MKINDELKQYIENTIFSSYKKNDLGHNLDHIKYVIDRSLKFASNLDDINYDMVYVIAAYHDIGHFIDAKNHEKVSADMLLEDINLSKYFTEDEIQELFKSEFEALSIGVSTRNDAMYFDLAEQTKAIYDKIT